MKLAGKILFSNIINERNAGYQGLEKVRKEG